MKYLVLMIVMTFAFSNLSFARKYYSKNQDGQSKWVKNKVGKDGKIKKSKEVSDKKNKKLDEKQAEASK